MRVKLIGQEKYIDYKSLNQTGKLLVRAAEERGLQYEVLIRRCRRGKKFIQDLHFRFKKGGQEKWLSTGRCWFNSSGSVARARYKSITNRILASKGLPVPLSISVTSSKKLDEVFKKLHPPLVAKPETGKEGKKVAANIYTLEDLREAVKDILKSHSSALIQLMVRGNDYRILALGSRILAGVRRDPPRVKGDGTCNLRELIRRANQNRIPSDVNILELRPYLRQIPLDVELKRFLGRSGLSLDYIPWKKEEVVLRGNANFSTGGETEDVTDRIHPKNQEIATKALKALGLEIGGVDIVCGDISRPITETGGKIVEVNSGPAIWGHHFPNKGRGQDVAGAIIDYLFNLG